MRPPRRTSCLLALALALPAGCTDDGGDRAAPSPTAAATSASPSPSPSPSRAPSRSPAPSASPTPGSTPSPLGTPMTTTGAYLRRATSGRPVSSGECETSWPDLLDVSCDDVRLDGGLVRWVAGTRDAGGGERQWVLRLHTPTGVGDDWALRYEAIDPTGEWAGFRVGAARLTGHGVDALVAQVRFDSSAGTRGYDLLTWRRGGPLVLGAHRREAEGLRVVARDGVLDDYAASGTAFLRSEVRWDGTRFRIRAVERVPASRVPPQA